MTIAKQILSIQNDLAHTHAKLIAVTKTRSIDELNLTYQAGILDFGENRVQELVEKQAVLPKDIRWHQIGHLQTNKVKYIAPFVHLIHTVDSLKLLMEINQQAIKNNRIIKCLFQIYIAQEETKFGLSPNELYEILENPIFAELQNIQIVGLMGMASFTENTEQINKEFNSLAQLFHALKSNHTAHQAGNVAWEELSMGMSGDYILAAALGSTLVRVGSAIYGARG
jgi:pyridoxal phosphate enzyme (YggS family)